MFIKKFIFYTNLKYYYHKLFLNHFFFNVCSIGSDITFFSFFDIYYSAFLSFVISLGFSRSISALLDLSNSKFAFQSPLLLYCFLYYLLMLLSLLFLSIIRQYFLISVVVHFILFYFLLYEMKFKYFFLWKTPAHKFKVCHVSITIWFKIFSTNSWINKIHSI